MCLEFKSIALFCVSLFPTCPSFLFVSLLACDCFHWRFCGFPWSHFVVFALSSFRESQIPFLGASLEIATCKLNLFKFKVNQNLFSYSKTLQTIWYILTIYGLLFGIFLLSVLFSPTRHYYYCVIFICPRTHSCTEGLSEGMVIFFLEFLLKHFYRLRVLQVHVALLGASLYFFLFGSNSISWSGG